MCVSEEICMSEEFKPTCGLNEVIMMRSAVYGRMGLGRCITQDAGHLGCYNGALSAFDSECSGKQACELEVTGSLWQDSEDACSSALMGYAEATYSCQQGILKTICSYKSASRILI